MTTPRFNEIFGFEVAVNYVAYFSLKKELFNTGAMDALAPTILINRQLAPAIFVHLNTEGKNCGCKPY